MKEEEQPDGYRLGYERIPPFRGRDPRQGG